MTRDTLAVLGVYWDRVRLAYAHLWHSDLRLAYLHDADLRDADLTGAALTRVGEHAAARGGTTRRGGGLLPSGASMTARRRAHLRGWRVVTEPPAAPPRRWRVRPGSLAAAVLAARHTLGWIALVLWLLVGASASVALAAWLAHWL